MTVDTTDTNSATKRNRGAIQATILAACKQPGAFVAVTALCDELNANVIYRWLSQRRHGNGAIQSGVFSAQDQQISSFIAQHFPESTAPQTVPMTTVTTAIRR